MILIKWKGGVGGNKKSLPTISFSSGDYRSRTGYLDTASVAL
jgi:hypothetical protein